MLLCTVQTIQAQEIADTLDLKEVVVTHSKSPLPLRQTIKPVSVIDRKTIDQNLGKDMSQLLQEQSGIIINGAYSNPGLNKNLYLRGAGNDNTLLLIDGQPLTDPSGVGGTFDLRLLSLDQIERIEILKGSQSTLYGSDALGGVINIITRSAGDKAIKVNGNLAYGSLNTFKGQVGANGTLGNFDYQISAGTQSTDGINEAVDLNDTGAFDKDGFNALNTQVKLGYRVSDQLRIQPFLRYNEFEGDYDGGAFTDADNQYESAVLNTGVNATWNQERLRTYFNYGYTQTQRTFNSTFGVNDFEGRFHNADAWVNYDLKEQLQLVAGLNFQQVQILDDAAAEIDPSETIISPYATLIYQAEKWSAEAGLRYNNHSTFGSNVNGSLALAYWLSTEVKVFGNYTTGFKAPLLSQLYGAFGANPELDPQTSRSFEAGLQYGIQNQGFFARASYFNRQIEEVIVFAFGPGYFNQDQQDDQGIDLEVGWRPNDQWQVAANYSYLDGEITTVIDAEQDTTFNNLTRRPKHTFGLSGTYRPIENLLVSAQFQYLDDRDDLFFNPDNFFAAEPVLLDNYYLLNLYAEFQLLEKRLTIFADLKNLTNQSFNEVYGFNSLGRVFLGGLRFSF
ncbi:MAG: TonB-dependent receptor [Saprospiraceae bacterium]